MSLTSWNIFYKINWNVNTITTPSIRKPHTNKLTAYQETNLICSSLHTFVFFLWTKRFLEKMFKSPPPLCESSVALLSQLKLILNLMVPRTQGIKQKKCCSKKCCIRKTGLSEAAPQSCTHSSIELSSMSKKSRPKL